MRPAMNNEKFTVRLPPAIVEALDAEAASRFTNRNQMIITIFLERYHIAQEKTRSANSRAAPIKRKPKQKAEVN
jgi:hypothetical protein